MASSMQHFTQGEKRLRDFIDNDAHLANCNAFSYTDQESAHRNRQLITGMIVALIAIALIAALLFI